MTLDNSYKTLLHTIDKLMRNYSNRDTVESGFTAISMDYYKLLNYILRNEATIHLKNEDTEALPEIKSYLSFPNEQFIIVDEYIKQWRNLQDLITSAATERDTTKCLTYIKHTLYICSELIRAFDLTFGVYNSQEVYRYHRFTQVMKQRLLLAVQKYPEPHWKKLTKKELIEKLFRHSSNLIIEHDFSLLVYNGIHCRLAFNKKQNYPNLVDRITCIDNTKNIPFCEQIGHLVAIACNLSFLYDNLENGATNDRIES